MQERRKAQTRFGRVWVESIEAEAAVLAEHREERRYRRMLALTDGVLGRLEQRNLTGQVELDDVILRDLGRTLAMLPPEARRRFPTVTTVQEALDGIFDVQEVILLVLQRMLHWDRLLTGPWDLSGDDESFARRTA